MTKYFCDCCGIEINKDTAARITLRQEGKTERYQVCNRCCCYVRYEINEAPFSEGTASYDPEYREV